MSNVKKYIGTLNGVKVEVSIVRNYDCVEITHISTSAIEEVERILESKGYYFTDRRNHYRLSAFNVLSSHLENLETFGYSKELKDFYKL